MKCNLVLKSWFLISLLMPFVLLGQKKDSSNIINFYALETDLTIPGNQEAIEAGRNLFALHCQECHALCRGEIGPALASVTERRPLVWLLSFIKNPRNVINQGDPYANHLFAQYGNKLMPEFDFLEEQEILNILSFIKSKSESEFEPSTGPPLNEEKVRPDYGEEYATEYYRNDSSTLFPVENERILNGKNLFQLHCQTCHNFCKSDQGPALSSVTDRRPLSWLMSFIKNPQQMMDEGDSYALYLHSHYDLVMPSFNFLKEDEIIDILAYIKDTTSAPVHISGSASDKNVSNPDSLKVPYADQDSDVDVRKKPQWSIRIIYIVIVALTVAIFVYLLARIWRKL